MSGRMKAAVYYSPRELQVETVDIPEIGPNDILMKVIACGICGSDVHSYGSGFYIDKGQIMGHEFVGEVVKVGEQVQGIEVGERGTGFSAGMCGECFWCKTEQYFLCPNLFKASTGYGLAGAFAEYVKISNAVPGATYHRVPDQIDDYTAATIEPVSVAVHTVNQCLPQAKDQVVVMGAGLIGNAILQVMKASPVSKVVVSEVSLKRLQAAKDMGADAVIDATSEDVLQRAKELIGVGPYHFAEGAMADIVVDAAGAPSAVEQSFEIVRSGGVIAFVGLPEKRASIDVTKIVHKAPRIVGCLGGDMGQAIELLKAEKVKTRPLITHVYPLSRANEAFEMQMNARDAIKVLVTPE